MYGNVDLGKLRYYMKSNIVLHSVGLQNFAMLSNTCRTTRCPLRKSRSIYFSHIPCNSSKYHNDYLLLKVMTKSLSPCQFGVYCCIFSFFVLLYFLKRSKMTEYWWSQQNGIIGESQFISKWLGKDAQLWSCCTCNDEGGCSLLLPEWTSRLLL